MDCIFRSEVRIRSMGALWASASARSDSVPVVRSRSGISALGKFPEGAVAPALAASAGGFCMDGLILSMGALFGSVSANSGSAPVEIRPGSFNFG
jgi:hypothetical protein